MIRVVNNIYKNKVEMMGFAAFIVVVNHCKFPNIFGLLSALEFCVDIFMLLGAFTCAGSFSRCMQDTSKTIGQNIMSFYKKRFLRIVPAYLILYSLYYFWLYIIHGNGDWAGFFKTFTFYGHFVDSSHLTLWYVPAILLAYLILPLYMLACEKNRMIQWTPLLLIICLIGLCILHVSTKLPFYMFFFRLPIFLIGINLYLCKDNLVKINHPMLLLTAGVFFILLTLVLDIPFYFNIRRLCFIPITFCILYFFDKFRFGNKLWHWLGGFTLEIYMFNDLLMRDIYPMIAGCFDNPTVATAFSYVLFFGIGIALAYFYHKFMNAVVYK